MKPQLHRPLSLSGRLRAHRPPHDQGRGRERLPRVAHRLGTPKNSRNPFHAGDDFRGFLVHTSATVCQFARLCPASGAFTSRLPAGWSPFPLQDLTTTATGLLCWQDSHPLEWQLASLHLLLHRDGLAPSTPCRSPGALRSTPINSTSSDRPGWSGSCQQPTLAMVRHYRAFGTTDRSVLH